MFHLVCRTELLHTFEKIKDFKSWALQLSRLDNSSKITKIYVSGSVCTATRLC